jgi:MinD superfamily P-loop ATPase
MSRNITVSSSVCRSTEGEREIIFVDSLRLNTFPVKHRECHSCRACHCQTRSGALCSTDRQGPIPIPIYKHKQPRQRSRVRVRVGVM